ncbi:MAG TPA: hypothetical protein VFI13_12230 [Gemmatimonadales bacterium]|nr:hypothetical protein [Gemmatimonadales bacterium]
MSRSRRQTLIIGMGPAPSEKYDKREANRCLRRIVRESLRADPAADVLPHVRDHSDPWTFIKDGKQWIDARKHPKEMRK